MNKTKILQYSITFAICTVFSFLYAVIGNIFSLTEPKEIFSLLTNATFSIGIITISFGLLVFASNGGAYDMIFYGISRFFSLFKKNYNDVKYKTFYDYHLAKLERPKSSFLFMIFIGLFFIVLSVIFLYFYYQAV